MKRLTDYITESKTISRVSLLYDYPDRHLCDCYNELASYANQLLVIESIRDEVGSFKKTISAAGAAHALHCSGLRPRNSIYKQLGSIEKEIRELDKKLGYEGSGCEILDRLARSLTDLYSLLLDLAKKYDAEFLHKNVSIEPWYAKDIVEANYANDIINGGIALIVYGSREDLDEYAERLKSRGYDNVIVEQQKRYGIPAWRMKIYWDFK